MTAERSSLPACKYAWPGRPAYPADAAEWNRSYSETDYGWAPAGTIMSPTRPTARKPMMEQHLINIDAASVEIETLELRIDQARGDLVRSLCEAMAAQVPVKAAAAAASMSVAELFDALRQHPDPVPPEDESD
ncbi:hypothetical protein [Pseudarthrobacter sp. N5]|uniref:hypothetical protein n=1 Tax=Pseudarthrobacter sp. N5 TaxID=3418416 RepID=UPI003CF913F1